MFVSPTFYEQGKTNRVAPLLWPLVPMDSNDITERPSLLWP
jgi:hypothetical protein